MFGMPSKAVPLQLFSHSGGPGRTLTSAFYANKLGVVEGLSRSKCQVELNENTEVFVHRITCNGSKVSDRKVLYPFITVDGSNKAFYVYEGAIITLTFDM